MMDSDKELQSIAKSSDTQPSEQESRPPLQEAVQTLSKTIKDLEKKLEGMLELNEALEKDLDKEKKKNTKFEQERDSLKEQIQRLEQELAGLDDLRADVDHLGQERIRLAAIIEEAGRQGVEAEHEYRKLERTVEQIRAERDDAIEEVYCLEAQFDHAMEIVADLKTRVATFAEERDALASSVKVIEARLQATEEQRDELKNEVEESRKALDDIRRQVADACVSSQRYYYQQTEDNK